MDHSRHAPPSLITLLGSGPWSLRQLPCDTIISGSDCSVRATIREIGSLKWSATWFVDRARHTPRHHSRKGCGKVNGGCDYAPFNCTAPGVRWDSRGTGSSPDQRDLVHVGFGSASAKVNQGAGSCIGSFRGAAYAGAAYGQSSCSV